MGRKVEQQVEDMVSDKSIAAIKTTTKPKSKSVGDKAKTQAIRDFVGMFKTEPVSTPADFVVRATEYFRKCELDSKQPMINGLALALGVNGKDGIKELEQREEFREVVQTAKSYICLGYEEQLTDRKVVGAIFALKQFGWTDKDPMQEAANDIASAMTAALKKVKDRKDKQVEKGSGQGR